MQGTRVRALVREDPTCRGATKPVRHDYWACTLEPACRNYWSPCATTTEARAPRAHVPQQEKPPQWEACATQRRVAPAHRTQRKPARSKEDPMQPKINKIKYINLFLKKPTPLAFQAKFSGGSSSRRQTPRLRSLTWGSELSLQWENFCGIIVFQFVGHPPDGYEIWFYCDFAPPTTLLWLLLCLWM